MAIEKGLRRLQLERLKTSLMADTTLTGAYYGDILLRPVFKPTVNTADNLPTLAIYCIKENRAFATTTQKRHPAAFNALLLFPEPENGDGDDYGDIYNTMLDTAQALCDALERLTKDCNNPDYPNGLWHKLTFGGDRKAISEGEINAGDFAVSYDRSPGGFQCAIITFFLSVNLARQF